MSPEVLLQAALEFPEWRGDRGQTREQRIALYMPVIQAIVKVGRDDREKAFLLAQAIEDTHLARPVLEGRCKDMPAGERCDNGRARGPFQVHPWCKATTLEGEASCTLNAALGGYARCRERSITPWHGAFAGLAARDCSWSGADKRVNTMRRILRLVTVTTSKEN